VLIWMPGRAAAQAGAAQAEATGDGSAETASMTDAEVPAGVAAQAGVES
jgi:hypothetical protein